jgi:hypothetical protein
MLIRNTINLKASEALWQKAIGVTMAEQRGVPKAVACLNQVDRRLWA